MDAAGLRDALTAAADQLTIAARAMDRLGYPMMAAPYAKWAEEARAAAQDEDEPDDWHDAMAARSDERQARAEARARLAEER